ncbi:hypothetical protein ACFVEN_41125 [Streptomyces sp. NPDC057681]|uniref:hypothetical protein n=1 Tax=Streptomyces sp. NPDC057681 TaxID=3346209 RepID=UPI003687B6C4
MSEADRERQLELRQEAMALYDESSAQRDALEHLQAQVYIEGPRRMISAAVDLGGKMTNFRHSVLDVIDPDASEGGDLQAAMDEASGTAYDAYLEFLYAASDAVGSDSLLALDH